MIRHDNIHTARPDIFDLFAVGYTAVDRDDEGRFILVDDLFERGDRHSVALCALGDMRHTAHAVFAQRRRQNGCGADTVCIIVAEYSDQSVRTAHGNEPVDELAHPAHQKGREEMLSGGRQKAANLIGGIYPPCIQNARRDLMQAAFGGDGTHDFILFGRKDVFRYDLFHAAASLSD